MNLSLPATLLTGVAVLLSACDAPGTAALPMPETTPLATPLAEALHPEGVKVMKYVTQGTGEMVTRTWNFAPGKIETTSTNGCNWTQGEMFGPSTGWKGCEGSEGNAKITSETGALWPLAVGKAKTWSWNGSNVRGGTWTDSRTCTVTAAEAIRTPVAERAAYRVDCKDSYRTFSVWWDPVAQAEVHVVHRINKTGKTTIYDEGV